MRDGLVTASLSGFTPRKQPKGALHRSQGPKTNPMEHTHEISPLRP